MMKKVLFAACSICLAATAAAAPLSAFAAEELPMPEYPQIYDELLKFEDLADFAVAGDNRMVFADGKNIVYWENSDTTVYEFDSTVTDVDYESGNIFYSLDGGDTSYILPSSPDELPGEQTEHDFNPPHITQTVRDLDNGFAYYYNENDQLIVVDKETETTTTLNYSNAKVYGGKLYAIADNLLHLISGLNAETVDVRYSNYDKLTTIPAGDIPEKLNTYATLGQHPQLVQIEHDALLTQIDLNNLINYDDMGNAYISVIEPTNIHEYLRGNVALLLYESDNVRIVAHGNSAYIVKADGASNLNYDITTPVEDGTKATVDVAGEYAHSLPFMSNATRTFAIAPNEELTVLYKISKFSDVLAYEYYLVENSEGERGYVISEFLQISQPPIAEGDPSDIGDPDPQTDNRIKTVVLIIVVIALVLIAVGYITWVSTTGKHKKPATNEDDGEDINADANKKDNKE